MRDRIKEVFAVFKTIQQTSGALKTDAENSHWLQFQKTLQERQVLLEKFERLMKTLETAVAESPEGEQEYARLQIAQLKIQFDILTKENSTIFDTIKGRREQLIDQFVKMNKGLDFLKAYEKKMMKKSLFSKIY